MPQVRKKCPHGKMQRFYCRECGGKAFCEHDRIRYSCFKCSGAGICEHGRVRNKCHECGGSSVCAHKRRRDTCKECGGSGICEHQRRRAICFECKGSARCPHGRVKQQCSQCQHFVCSIEGCDTLGHRFSSFANLLKHMRGCHGANPKALTKRKELEVHQLLGQAGLQFQHQHHLPFRSCGLESDTQRAFADFVLYASWGAVILEEDENQHSERDASCDVRRDFDMAASVALGSAHKLAIVRYNPDAFKLAGRTVRTSKKERHALPLLHSLERQFQRIFLYYDREVQDSELPAVAEHWDVVARTVSRAVV